LVWRQKRNPNRLTFSGAHALDLVIHTDGPDMGL